MKKKIPPTALQSIASQLGVDLPQKQVGRVEAPTLGGPVPITFEEKCFEYFDVEFTERGEDVIYHFWPPNDGDTFLPNFSKYLEDGFKLTLPSNADVRAEYTSKLEASVLATHSEWPLKLDKETRTKSDALWLPRETYYVCVLGGAKNPFASAFLKDRVFRNISKAILDGGK